MKREEVEELVSQEKEGAVGFTVRPLPDTRVKLFNPLECRGQGVLGSCVSRVLPLTSSYSFVVSRVTLTYPRTEIL